VSFAMIVVDVSMTKIRITT